MRFKLRIDSGTEGPEDVVYGLIKAYNDTGLKCSGAWGFNGAYLDTDATTEEVAKIVETVCFDDYGTKYWGHLV